MWGPGVELRLLGMEAGTPPEPFCLAFPLVSCFHSYTIGLKSRKTILMRQRGVTADVYNPSIGEAGAAGLLCV